MKTVVCFILFYAILVPGLPAQRQANSSPPQPYKIQISAGVAEKLLINKSEIICPRIPMAAHIIGTVGVAIVIDVHGNVSYAKVISGPAMLRNPVLDAVRKYKYKPYLLNGKAVEVKSVVWVTMDSKLDCHYD